MIVTPQKVCQVRRMYGTVECSKQVKNLLNHTYFNDCVSQKFVATILVPYVKILAEPDLSIQN